MTVAVVVGAGLVPAVLAPAAQAAGTAGTAASAQEPETVVPAPPRWQPPLETVLTAGAGGYFAETDAKTYHWVNTSNGTQSPGTIAAGQFNGSVHGILQSGTAATVDLTDYASGTVETVTAPAGQTWLGGFSGHAILTAQSGPDGLSLHVITPADDGTASDTPVQGVPADGTYNGFAPGTVLSQNGQRAVVRLSTGGGSHLYLLDFGTASMREIFAGLPGSSVNLVVLGGGRVVGWSGSSASAIAYSVRLDDPAATVEQTPIPQALLPDARPPKLVPVGDRILIVRGETGSTFVGQPLVSVPVGGGNAQTLLDRALWTYAVAPDGSVLVTGGSGPTDWAVRRITAAPGADPVLSTVTPLPVIPATVYGLSYSGGELIYNTTPQPTAGLLRRKVSVGANPGVSDPVPVANNGVPGGSCPSVTGTTPCARMQGLGNGGVAYFGSLGLTSPGNPDANGPAVNLPVMGASSVADGSATYIIVNTPTASTQTVVDLSQENAAREIVLTRPITASAVWGSTLWVPGTTAGTVRPYDLRTRTFGTTVKTAATCGVAFKELQADGRWLYWSCGTSAGIHDVQTGKDIAVPAGTVGDALLGDGYLVRHDATSGDLLLTDVHSGSAVTSTLANLPVTITADRNVLWSVDKYGGGVAYVDAQQRIHVLPLADLPRSPLSIVASTVTSQGNVDIADFAGGLYLNGGWTFSRPPGSWNLAIKDAAGTTVATPNGTAADPTGSHVSARWDLKTSSGAVAHNGTYHWTFTAEPGDGQGAPVTASGTFGVTGSSVRRDFNADGRGDLFGLMSAGKLDVRGGTAAGGLSLVATGAGWPSSDTLVPFGDLDGDRLNDLLVRDSAGRLWLYSGHGKPTFTPSAPHTLLGSGYQQYNQLLSPGDMNGDGRPDLLARDASGKLWLHAGADPTGFAPRTLVGNGYQQYTLIAGGGWNGGQSYNGDGQILARDASGVLWIHVTDGKGHFQSRWQVGSGWNQYNAVVAVGSLKNNGFGDIIARDSRGGLWRFTDEIDGTLSGPAWEGGGWQMYTRLL
jgi:hypothetical protein